MRTVVGLTAITAILAAEASVVGAAARSPVVAVRLPPPRIVQVRPPPRFVPINPAPRGVESKSTPRFVPIQLPPHIAPVKPSSAETRGVRKELPPGYMWHFDSSTNDSSNCRKAEREGCRN